MTLVIHPYTIKICSQELTIKGKYKYIALESLNLQDLTQDQLDHVYSQGQEILETISAETFRRME